MKRVSFIVGLLVMGKVVYGGFGWHRTGKCNSARAGHAGCMFTDGRVMVTGGHEPGSYNYEIFNPATGEWERHSLPGGVDLFLHGITILLPNGDVLLVESRSSNAELYLYNPPTNAWTNTGLTVERGGRNPATLLRNGKVLILGEDRRCWIYEYSPSPLVREVGSYSNNHGAPAEALLLDGNVLLTGLSTWEIFDVTQEVWTESGDMVYTHSHHAMIRLPDGNILIAGGEQQNGCEIFNFMTKNCNATDALANRYNRAPAMVLLPNGLVLHTGGENGNATIERASCELYDWERGEWDWADTMGYTRSHHIVAVMYTGKVLAAGAYKGTGVEDPENGGNVKCEIYDPSQPRWANLPGGMSLKVPRRAHTATVLPIISTGINCSTNVLIAGGENSSGFLSSAELVNYSEHTVVETPPMNTARAYHCAVLLTDGNVLVCGGENSSGAVSSCELFNVRDVNWNPTGGLNTARFNHTATLLGDGRVLVTGGENGGSVLSSCEIYDNGSWSSAGNMNTPRTKHTAVLLYDGRVMVMGGEDASGNALSSCEIWNGSSWEEVSAMQNARSLHTAVVLQSGKVMVIGGKSGNSVLSSCEVYEGNSWSREANLRIARYAHNATLLYSGIVLVSGGIDGNGNYVRDSELWDPADNLDPDRGIHYWYDGHYVVPGRAYHSSVLIPSIRPFVLTFGGYDGNNYLTSIQRHDVGLGYRREWQSIIDNYQAVTPVTPEMEIRGTLFRGISEADGGNHCHIVSSDHPIISLVRVGGGNWQGNGGGDLMLMPHSTSWDEVHTTVQVGNAPQGYYRLWAIVNGIPTKWYENCYDVEEGRENRSGRIVILPNPSCGVVFMRFREKGKKEVEVYDCVGRIVKRVKTREMEIKIEELNEGVYFYKIRTERRRFEGKFVVIK